MVVGKGGPPSPVIDENDGVCLTQPSNQVPTGMEGVAAAPGDKGHILGDMNPVAPSCYQVTCPQ